jgi:hypothetical protein
VVVLICHKIFTITDPFEVGYYLLNTAQSMCCLGHIRMLVIFLLIKGCTVVDMRRFLLYC